MDLDVKIAAQRDRLHRDIAFAKLVQKAGAEGRDRDAATSRLPVLYRRLQTLDSRAKVAERRWKQTLKVFALGILSGIGLVKYGWPALCWVICR